MIWNFISGKSLSSTFLIRSSKLDTVAKQIGTGCSGRLNPGSTFPRIMTTILHSGSWLSSRVYLATTQKPTLMITSPQRRLTGQVKIRLTNEPSLKQPEAHQNTFCTQYSTCLYFGHNRPSLALFSLRQSPQRSQTTY